MSRKILSDPNWKFADSMNVYVFTIKSVLDGKEEISHVYHNEEDGAWQFLPDRAVSEKEAKVVSLAAIVNFDPTLQELYNLPLGYHAYRDKKGWKVSRTK